MPWPAIAGAAIGGIASALGASKQQTASKEMAREQMRFQERMSSTAYQRAAKDLEAAGLNRIIALGSPASSPGGAMGQAQNIGAAGVAGVSSALQSAQTLAQVRNTKLQGDIIAPEAHRARIVLGIQKAAEKGVRKGARTFGMPTDQPGKGEPYPGKTFADTPLGERISNLMNKVNDWTMGRSGKSSIETPSTAKEVPMGTIQQHMEQWILDYTEKHKGKSPTEDQLRKEWERVKDLY